MLSRVGRTFFKEYMLSMVHRTTPWSKPSSDTFDVDDGGCFRCCCSSSLGFQSDHIFFLFSVFWPKMSILIEITNGQPIPLMLHIFVVLLVFRILALENIAKILTTGPRLLLVMCLLLLFHNFLSGRSANASEWCSPVPYTIQ